jgi:hypothetical protein
MQAALLIGWALGGGIFGRVGDLLALSASLYYLRCVHWSFIAQTWWHLMIFRFWPRWVVVANGLLVLRCCQRLGRGAGVVGLPQCCRRV